MPAPPETVRAAHFRQLDAHRLDPEYQHLDGYEDRAAFFGRQIGRRWEIDEAIFEEFLDLLPPLGWTADRFYLSEFLFDDITHRFSREGGRYFCAVVRYPERPKREPLAVAVGPGRQPKG